MGTVNLLVVAGLLATQVVVLVLLLANRLVVVVHQLVRNYFVDPVKLLVLLRNTCLSVPIVRVFGSACSWDERLLDVIFTYGQIRLCSLSQDLPRLRSSHIYRSHRLE
jgi:hypothetical protein